MSSIKYIIGQYSRVNSFIRSRGCAALDRINEFTREYCPITYTCRTVFYLYEVHNCKIRYNFITINILSTQSMRIFKPSMRYTKNCLILTHKPNTWIHNMNSRFNRRSNNLFHTTTVFISCVRRMFVITSDMIT